MRNLPVLLAALLFVSSCRNVPIPLKAGKALKLRDMKFPVVDDDVEHPLFPNSYKPLLAKNHIAARLELRGKGELHIPPALATCIVTSFHGQKATDSNCRRAIDGQNAFFSGYDSTGALISHSWCGFMSDIKRYYYTV